MPAVVVTVYQGRYFPRRPQQALMLEAQLDGQVLKTDPVPHVPDFDVNNELAWLMDRATFQSHKMRRTQLKLKCYAVDQGNQQREEVGYIMLDLRSAQQTSTGPLWLPVLNCIYRDVRPEFKISLSLEMKEPMPEEPPAAPEIFATPATDNQPGSIQIGPADSSSALYHLRLTLSDCGSLLSLLDTSISAAEQCQLAVTGLPLPLKSPKFPVGRPQDILPCHFDVNIQASAEHLTETLTTFFPLKLSASLADDGKADRIFAEGFLNLTSAPQQLSELSVNSEVALQATGGDADASNTCKMAVQLSVTQQAVQASQSAAHRKELLQSLPATTDGKSSSKEEDGKSDKPLAPPAQPPTSAGSAAPTSTNIYKQARDLPAGAREFSCAIDLQTVRRHTVTPQILKVYFAYRYAAFGTATPVLTHPPIEVLARSTRPISHGFTSFQFTSTYDHIMDAFASQPLLLEAFHVDTYRGHEPIAQGLIHLKALFEKLPVQTPMAERAFTAEVDVDLYNDKGDKVLTVRALLTVEDRGAQENPPILDGPGGGPLRVANRTPPAVPPVQPESDALKDLEALLADSPEAQREPSLRSAATSRTRNVGEGAPGITAAAAATAFTADARSADTASEFMAASPVPPSASALPEAALQRAALDLELWMRQEQARFQERLEAKERAALKTLADEWRSRLREREAVLQRKLESYSQLETDLQRALREIQQQESQLTDRQQRLERRERALQEEHARALADMRDASRRLEQDLEHQAELLERKLAARDEEIRSLQRERSREDDRVQRLQAEVDALRQAQAQGPNATLQAKVLDLSSQVADLQRKLGQARRAKSQYKDQWKQALEALARLRQKEQLVAKEYLRREQRELEQMRLQYLAQEERQSVGKEREQLAVLRQQVSQLQRLATTPVAPAGGLVGDATFATAGADDGFEAGASGKQMGQMAPSLFTVRRQQQDLARMMEERQSLLQSGIYSPDDAVIRELDRRISALMPAVGASVLGEPAAEASPGNEEDVGA